MGLDSKRNTKTMMGLNAESITMNLKKMMDIRVLHTTKGWNADKQGDVTEKCCSTFDAVVPCSTFQKVGNSEVFRQLRYYKWVL